MTAVELRDDEATAVRSERAITILTDALEDFACRGSVRLAGSRRVFMTAAGWWIGMTRSAQAVVVLRRAGLEHESGPIVRTILQHGLVLQWLVDGGDQAVDAVAQYGHDNLRKLLQTLSDANWELPEGFAVPVLPAPSSALQPLVDRLKVFERLCVEYRAKHVYVLFRLLSGYAHPTSTSAMAYVDAGTDSLTSRAASPGRAHVIQTAMCLIQAGHAVSSLVADDPLRSALVDAEKALGCQITAWSRL
jgi:hypothetical protein